jgi:uncharacterized membrane protein
MLSLISAYQQGPPDDRGLFGNQWFLLLAAVIIVLLIILIIAVLFPRLKSVNVTKTLEKEVHEAELTSVKENKVVENPWYVTLKLLNEDERNVVKALRDAGGSMLQKDLSYNLKLSRVKTHRVLVGLIERGVVKAEKYYNTNKITLSTWLMPD